MKKRISLMLVCVAVAGCSSTSSGGIRGGSDSLVIPEVEYKASRNFTASTGIIPDGVALDASYSFASADITQNIPVGEFVEFDSSSNYTGNQRYDGPVDLNHKADIGVGYLGGHFFWLLNEKTEFSYRLGIGNVGMKIETSGGGLSSTFEDSMTGIYGGYGLSYKYNDKIDIEALYLLHVNIFEMLPSFSKEYSSSLSDMRLRLVFKQNKWLRYFIGYKQLKYGYSYPDRNNDPSSIHLDFSGVNAGIGMYF